MKHAFGCRTLHDQNACHPCVILRKQQRMAYLCTSYDGLCAHVTFSSDLECAIRHGAYEIDELTRLIQSLMCIPAWQIHGQAPKLWPAVAAAANDGAAWC